jgi:putative Mn2+ efflux pump MntP
MKDRSSEYFLRICAGILTVAGVITVLVGYVQLRDESDVVLQLPYVMSAGIGGLILVGLGAVALIQAQMQTQTRRAAEVAEQLDEWKDAALAEIRSFLEGARIEVEIDPPVLSAPVGNRAVPSRTAG